MLTGLTSNISTEQQTNSVTIENIMIEVMQSSWITVLLIIFTVTITPFFWFLVLPNHKAIILAWTTAVIAAIMSMIVLFDVPGRLGPAGGAIIGFMWVVPSLIVWKHRNWFKGLDQRPVAGLQIFRLLGVVFIIEMFRGNIPASFAWPAGIGDIIVGLFAVFLFVSYKSIPRSGLVALIIVGLTDFLSAFFFGFTSLEGPAQVFAKGFNNQANLFPTGIIPFFLVPYAISFHIISLINLKK